MQIKVKTKHCPLLQQESAPFFLLAQLHHEGNPPPPGYRIPIPELSAPEEYQLNIQRKRRVPFQWNTYLFNSIYISDSKKHAWIPTRIFLDLPGSQPRGIFRSNHRCHQIILKQNMCSRLGGSRIDRQTPGQVLNAWP